MRVWRHRRALWPRYTPLPPAPFFAWGLYMVLAGRLRWDHVAMMLLVPALAYGTATTKRICVGAYPMALVGLLYDMMKLVQNVGVTVARVRVCDLRAAEMALFGITVGGERMTLHDWFLVHHSTFADLWCAVPYGTFIFVDLGFCFYLYWNDLRAMQHLRGASSSSTSSGSRPTLSIPQRRRGTSTTTVARSTSRRARARDTRSPASTGSSASTTSPACRGARATCSARCPRSTSRIRCSSSSSAGRT